MPNTEAGVPMKIDSLDIASIGLTLSVNLPSRNALLLFVITGKKFVGGANKAE